MTLSIYIYQRHKHIRSYQLTNTHRVATAYEDGIDDLCSPDGNSFLIQATACMHRKEAPTAVVPTHPHHVSC